MPKCIMNVWETPTSQSISFFNRMLNWIKKKLFVTMSCNLYRIINKILLPQLFLYSNVLPPSHVSILFQTSKLNLHLTHLVLPSSEWLRTCFSWSCQSFLSTTLSVKGVSHAFVCFFLSILCIKLLEKHTSL